jgi:DNA sulfur modification protein DndE
MRRDRITTTRKAEDELEHLRALTKLEYATIARIAVAASLRRGEHLLNIDEPPDHMGKEIRLVSLAPSDILELLLAQHYGRALNDDEYTEILARHVNRGVEYLSSLQNSLEREQGSQAEFRLYQVLASEFGQPKPNSNRVSTVAQAGLQLRVGANDVDKGPYFWKINDSSTNPHTAIIGQTRTGKTQLVLSLIQEIRRASENESHFIFFDYKGEDAIDERFLRTTAASLLDPSNHPLPVNPFILSNYSDRDVRLSAHEKAFMLHTFDKRIGARQRGDLRQAILNAYERCRDQLIPYPDFQLVYNELLQLRPSPETVHEVLSIMVDGNLFHRRDSGDRPLDTLVGNSLIVRLSRVPTNFRPIVVSFVLERLAREMESLPTAPIDSEQGTRQLRTCVVIDEAHNYLDKNHPFLMKLLREGAGKGIAIVLISQSPADFKQKFGYHEHIGNVFLFNTNAVDATSVKQLMRCTDDYSHTIVGQVLQLPTGICLFSQSGKGRHVKLRAEQFWQTN